MDEFSGEQSGDSSESLESTNSQQEVNNSEPSGSEAVQQLIDLDKTERFRFSGQELTPKDLQSMVMRHSDYTRKTQAIAQERSYMEALSIDLEAVSKNSSLADKFKEIYPEKYHKFLNYVMKEAQGNPRNPANPLDSKSDIRDPRVDKLESELGEWRKEKESQQVTAMRQEIDGHISKAITQYTDVLKTDSVKQRFELDCLNLAQNLHGQGIPLNAETWGKITKHVATDLGNIFNVTRSDVVKKQTQANARGKDVPPGGGIPGQAPGRPKHKSFKDALRASLEEGLN